MTSIVPFFVDFVDALAVELTPAQRVLALVAFDGLEPHQLEPSDRAIAAKLFGPIDTIAPQARGVLVIVKGARVGGTYVFAALYSLWRAATADLSRLAPGEQASALIVAPDLRLARQALRYVQGALAEHRWLGTVTSKTEDTIVLQRAEDGREVRIEVLPATRGGSALRGRSLVSAVLSEAAFFRDESAVVNDVDCFKAVAPRVMPGGMVVLESTPWIEAGLVFDEFTRNFATPKTAIAAHAPTELMRPDEHTRSLVARERDRDPDNAEREFDAQFIGGGSGLFFGPELLTPALDRDLTLATMPRAPAVVGGDLGLVKDASAFTAVRKTPAMLYVAGLLEIRPKKGAPLKLSRVVQQGCEFAARHGQHVIRVDHHELVAAREHLPAGFRLKACRGGSEAKEDRYVRTRKAFREGRIRIPAQFQKLVTQLGLVIAKPKPGGGTQIVLPRRAGTHLDLAAAFVLAVDGATSRRNRMAEALLDPANMRWLAERSRW